MHAPLSLEPQVLSPAEFSLSSSPTMSGLAPLRPNAPIGVFDSGIGGLSVLQALREELPHEDFLYLADSGFAPYGERGDAFVLERSTSIARYLVEQRGIKLLVVACNTATAAAIQSLRRLYPSLPLVGVEPALKPALAASRTRRVGVAATQGTLRSGKFRQLLDSLAGSVDFVLQPCPGLALALEQSVALDPGDLQAVNDNQQLIGQLIARYLAEMGPFGQAPGEIDTLVLGCTHYPFARSQFQAAAGSDIVLLETGVPVARQTRRLLENHGLLQGDTLRAGGLMLASTGMPQALKLAAERWLHLAPASVIASTNERLDNACSARVAA